MDANGVQRMSRDLPSWRFGSLTDWPDRVDTEVVAQRRPTVLNGVEPQDNGVEVVAALPRLSHGLVSMAEEVKRCLSHVTDHDDVRP